MNTLRLQLRFLLPLLAVLVATAFVAALLVDRLTLRWFAHDLDLRGTLVAGTLSDAVADALQAPGERRLDALFARAVLDERLLAIGLCAGDGRLLQRSAGFPADLDCGQARDAAARPGTLRVAGGAVHVGVFAVDGAAAPASSASVGPAATLVLVHDLSFVERRSSDTQLKLVGLIAALGLVIAVTVAFVAQRSWRGWVAGVRALVRDDHSVAAGTAGISELAPVADELRQRLRDLEDEHRRALGPQSLWNPERLRELLRMQLRGDQVIVVSNREPYSHEATPEGVVVRRPASGLVTAVEPVMRACSGTWIAHGAGSADRETVDAHDRVAVPPGSGEYTLRRLWLSEEEEQGYYFGFANEGLWPLCHVAHVRPVFRETDWLQYRAVNERFADAVVAEARSEDPVVLVQDYHFALLPALIRKRLPRATILTFWHIPWPNPESFGICPWRREILQGLLGSTILGFHTRYHCRNFIDTVDRYLETRIEHETSTIAYGGAQTLVESYPISIAWPSDTEVAGWPTVAGCRSAVFQRFGMAQGQRLAVGVDRFDYTKGLLERLHAVDRLLEKYPQWVGVFSFVQIAAPTRSSLDEYRAFQQRIERVCERINSRHGRAGYQPVHLLAEHHERAAVTELYRAADVCLVTSLHDGMNLVCKEFVAARDDEQGVLILSRFAGAVGELPEALIVNPYHVEDTADALHRALDMPAAEQRERMASMRMTVRGRNVYRWAGRMLADAAQSRLRERIDARLASHHRGEPG